jgi:hypothetical protein
MFDAGMVLFTPGLSPPFSLGAARPGGPGSRCPGQRVRTSSSSLTHRGSPRAKPLAPPPTVDLGLGLGLGFGLGSFLTPHVSASCLSDWSVPGDEEDAYPFDAYSPRDPSSARGSRENLLSLRLTGLTGQSPESGREREQGEGNGSGSGDEAALAARRLFLRSSSPCFSTLFEDENLSGSEDREGDKGEGEGGLDDAPMGDGGVPAPCPDDCHYQFQQPFYQFHQPQPSQQHQPSQHQPSRSSSQRYPGRAVFDGDLPRLPFDYEGFPSLTLGGSCGAEVRFSPVPAGGISNR